MEPIEPRVTAATAPTEPPNAPPDLKAPPTMPPELRAATPDGDFAKQLQSRMDYESKLRAEQQSRQKLAEQAVSLMDTIGAEGQKAPEPVPAKPPISGLVVGRVVHVLDKGQLKAGIVAQVHDDAEGDITVRVQEPSGPTRAWRLPWSGAYQSLAEGCWQWMFDGQAGRYRPSV